MECEVAVSRQNGLFDFGLGAGLEKESNPPASVV